MLPRMREFVGKDFTFGSSRRDSEALILEMSRGGPTWMRRQFGRGCEVAELIPIVIQQPQDRSDARVRRGISGVEWFRRRLLQGICVGQSSLRPWGLHLQLRYRWWRPCGQHVRKVIEVLWCTFSLWSPSPVRIKRCRCGLSAKA